MLIIVQVMIVTHYQYKTLYNRVVFSTKNPLQTGTPENRKPLESEQFCQS